MTTFETDEKVEIVSDISRAIVEHWTGMTHQPLNEPQVLHYLYRQHNCSLEFRNGVSSYCPDENEDGPAGVALVNPNQLAPFIIRDMAHELTHHVLFWWLALQYPCLWNEQIAALGALRDLEEKICHGVADLVQVPLDDIQANSKIAAPNLPTVARCYQRVSIPGFMAMSAEEIDDYEAEERDRSLFF